MNFFESQDVARRNTGRLILLFSLAVVSLIIITNLLVMIIFGFAQTSGEGVPGSTLELFDWQTFLAVGVGVSAIVLFGSLYKIASLSGGGARVAEMMNGRLLLPDSEDLLERRTLNVVEEMAIASGTPVPPVYVLEEAGINAFAAGYTPSDAVIGITRGAMEILSRDQLQGVIAHEFSHILHGDMRINIRLIGVLHGILVLGIIGYYLLRGGAHARRSKDSGGIVMLGLGLVVIGYVGTFFGNLIKAAVSRQREYLADASAVQYTRNPEGIGGALMQIGYSSAHSYLDNPAGREISHALFEEGGKTALSGLYATHPPLEERIRAILPNWDGSYDLIHRPQAESPEPETAVQDEQGRREQGMGILAGAAGVGLGQQAVERIGQPDGEHLHYADQLVRSIPKALLAAARQPSSARALIYLLVLDSGDDVRQAQLRHLQDAADQGVFAELQRLLDTGLLVADEQRLPLVEIALPSLRQLSARQYELFKVNFEKVIAQDNKLSLFEWCLQKFLFHHLDQVFGSGKTRRLGRKPLQNCQSSIAVLLALFSRSNKPAGLTAEQVYAKGLQALEMEIPMPALKELDYKALDGALGELVKVRPLQKPALLKACVACILADQQVAAVEAELLRTVAAILDCPMPPLITNSGN